MRERSVVLLLIAGFIFFNELQFILNLLRTPEGKIYLGSVHSAPDYFYYLSQMAQGRFNLIFSTLNYTAEKMPYFLVGWERVLMGFIFLHLGINVIRAYQLSLIIFSAILFYLIYRYLSEIYRGSPGKRLLSLFFYLSSTSLPIITVSRGVIKSGYFNYWYNPGNIAVRLGATWHHKVGEIAFIGILLSVLKYISKQGKRSKLLVLISFLSLVLSSINPVHILLVLLTVFLFLAWEGKVRNIFLLLSITVPGIIAGYYNVKVFSIPPFNTWAPWEANQQVNMNLLTLLKGSGLSVVFAIMGFWGFLKRSNRAGRMMLILILVSAFFYFTKIPYYLKLSNARFWPATVYIGIAGMATAGVYSTTSLFRKYSRIAFCLLAVIYIPLTIVSYREQYKEILATKTDDQFELSYLSEDVYTGFIQAEKISGREDLFLVESPYHWTFPSLTGRKSFFGYQYFTVEPEIKNREGIAFFTTAGNEERQRILDKYGIDYVIARSRNGMLNNFERLEMIYSNEKVSIYKTGAAKKLRI